MPAPGVRTAGAGAAPSGASHALPPEYRNPTRSAASYPGGAPDAGTRRSATGFVSNQDTTQNRRADAGIPGPGLLFLETGYRLACFEAGVFGMNEDGNAILLKIAIARDAYHDAIDVQ